MPIRGVTIYQSAICADKIFFTFPTPYVHGCLRGSFTIAPMKNKNEQLELIQNQNCKSPLRRNRRRDRAAFWFARMRQLVDSATDWRRLPSIASLSTLGTEATAKAKEGTPEQIWFHQ